VMRAFGDRFGPWALVAGASEGLGAAFAHALAGRGLNLVLLDRRAALLEALADDLRANAGVEVHTLALDLGGADLAPRLEAVTADLEVGLVIYNAAHSVVEPFLDQPLSQHLRAVEVNCRGPLVLAHLFGPGMRARARGGLLLMSSLAGLQGSALIATYAATKAFNTVLAESLFDELRHAGVTVLACQAGATRTPGYIDSAPRRAGLDRVLAQEQEPGQVVQEALAALARGEGGAMIPGRGNRLAAQVMRRLLPRRLAVALMGSATRRLYGR